MNATERLWLPNNANERNRTSQSCAEAWWVPREAWLNVQKRRQSWLDRHQSWLGISKTASRRSNTVMEPAVATQPPGQFALRSMATHGDASTLTYNRVQLTALDGTPWRTDISPALDGGSFEHFKTSVRQPSALAPSGARRHSPTVVSAPCGAQLRLFTVFEPPLSADKNRQCVIVAIWASGVPKLNLLSHFTVCWGLVNERRKTRISPCNMSYSMFSGSLNSLVPSLDIKKSSFSDGKLVSYKTAFWRFSFCSVLAAILNYE